MLIYILDPVSLKDGKPDPGAKKYYRSASFLSLTGKNWTSPYLAQDFFFANGPPTLVAIHI